MEPSQLLRRTVVGLAGVLLSLVLLTAVARADEGAAGSPAHGFPIHGPEETLRDFCRLEDGRLWFVLPEGARFELVTSTDDPAISNPGDGTFHPFDTAEVRAALEAVRFPLAATSADIYLLPYPRRTGLESATGPGLILLSPGVVPLAVERQHAELTHELGHVVHLGLMPDHVTALWSRYCELRDIADATVYSATARHADRPHEIFAEDFRALFGGPLANYSGSIENSALEPPAIVAGLEAFMLGLAVPSGPALRAFPNPTRGVLSFRRGDGEAAPLDLFDVTGRRIATLMPTVNGDGWLWRWDGRNERGETAGPGVLLARVRGSREPGLRLIVTR